MSKYSRVHILHELAQNNVFITRKKKVEVIKLCMRTKKVIYLQSFIEIKESIIGIMLFEFLF